MMQMWGRSQDRRSCHVTGCQRNDTEGFKVTVQGRSRSLMHRVWRSQYRGQGPGTGGMIRRDSGSGLL